MESLMGIEFNGIHLERHEIAKHATLGISTWIRGNKRVSNQHCLGQRTI